jgi:hypothetical protein
MEGAVDRGSSDAEQLGKFGLGVGAEVVQLEQVRQQQLHNQAEGP